MDTILIALIIFLASVIIIGLVLRKIHDNRKEILFVDIMMVFAFIVIFAISLLNVTSWVPLKDVFNSFSLMKTNWDIIFHVLVILAYSASGFSLGLGFLQLTHRVGRRIKGANTALAIKKFLMNVVKFFEYCFFVLVIVFMLYALFDVFGLLYANPVVQDVLIYMTLFPFAWKLVGLIVFTLKAWRDPRINLNYALEENPKYVSPEKIYFHRLLLMFMFWLVAFIFFVFEFVTAPGVLYPTTIFFAFSLFLGYNLSWKALDDEQVL